MEDVADVGKLLPGQREEWQEDQRKKEGGEFFHNGRAESHAARGFLNRGFFSKRAFARACHRW